MEMLTLDAFEEAAECVKRVTRETKLIYSDYFSAQTGNKVYLKAENMQVTGAYKIRGAYFKTSKMCIRDSIVCEPTLALCAREIHLEQYLLLGKGEEHTGGRYRDSIISDAMEALIGAIYLDGGFANAKEFVEKFIHDESQLYEHFRVVVDKGQAMVRVGRPDQNH